jgi:hypothetical protein
VKFSFQSETSQIEEASSAPLDLVVPVTAPELTRASIRAALDLASAPAFEFIREQLEHYFSALSPKRELKLARDFDSALLAVLDKDSLVLLTARKRPWRTRNERLACSVRRAGYPVILTFEGENHA